jgi:hypothetical protein
MTRFALYLHKISKSFRVTHARERKQKMIDVVVFDFNKTRSNFATLLELLRICFPNESFELDDDHDDGDRNLNNSSTRSNVESLSPAKLDKLIDSCCGFFTKEQCIWCAAYDSQTQKVCCFHTHRLT